METFATSLTNEDYKFTMLVHNRIHSIKNLFTFEQCRKLINNAEEAGFKPSPPSGGGHGQTPRTGARTSQFYVKDDPRLAEYIWKEIKNYVPSDLKSIKQVPYMNSVSKGDEYTPVCVNEHIRFYKYDPGQFILKHDDYRMSRFRYDEKEDQYYEQMSFLTIVIYLNDDFNEGCTKFWTTYSEEGTKSHCRFIRDIEFTDANLIIRPETGKAVIHDHMVQHEGEAPTKSTKYILRTDVMHEKKVSSNKVEEKFKKGQTLGEWHRHFEPSCFNYTE